MKNIDQLLSWVLLLLSWVLFSFQSANKPAPHNVFLGCLWCDLTDLLVKSGLLAPSDFFFEDQGQTNTPKRGSSSLKELDAASVTSEMEFRPGKHDLTHSSKMAILPKLTRSGLKLVSEFFFVETELVASTRVLYKGCVAPSSGVKWNGREVDVSVL